uniref:F-box domain-containing protein n=2 Tax=Stomoxys calcitrans TaxID=35570 RepID=A0A1I8NQS3_STOCA
MTRKFFPAMDILNADCLREIIIHLSLQDQIALLQVNRYLQQIVQSLWITKYKHNSINFVEKSLKDEDLERFFKTIKDFAESFELRFLDEQKYKLLKKFTYPQIKTVRLTIHPCFIRDEDIKDFHLMFPNLRVFSPHGNLTGRYLDLWPNLTELNLSYCYKLELSYFHSIMRSLHLEHLELNMFPMSKQCEQLDLKEANLENLKYLRLNTYELYYFLVKPMPKLQHLYITNQYNPRQLFDVILSVWRARDIRKLETNVKNVLANCLEMRMNVEELCIINDDNVLPQNVIRSLHLLDDLRVLRFKSCDLTTINIAELLRSIPQIDEISLESCRLPAQLKLNAVELGEERSKLLRLNFWQNIGRRLRNSPEREYRQNTPQSVDVIIKGEHSFFEFTEIPGVDLYFEPLYIQFR